MPITKSSTRRLSLGLLLTSLSAFGCADTPPRANGGSATLWQAERDTVGDTLVVRTVSGSEWGDGVRLVEEQRLGQLQGPEEYSWGQIAALAADDEMSLLVLDELAPALLVYDADGAYVRTIGRQGGGPGEYNGPDGGLAILDDGRVLLRDPSTQRINVYSIGGEPLDEWPIRGGFSTTISLFTDTASNAYQFVWDFQANGRRSLVRYSSTGEPGDTLFVPVDYDAPILTAQVEGSMRTMRVPFSPQFHWSFSPLGYYVGGISNRYAIHLYRSNSPVLRIESSAPPVEVSSEERRNERALVISLMRTVEPGWDWDGPSIPDEKPAFSDIVVDRDGRIWVQLHVAGERIPADELIRDDDDDRRPVREFREAVVYDVFEPDGLYLGRLHMPPGFQSSPTPFIRGDLIWGVVTGEFDVQYVVRLRIDTGLNDQATTSTRVAPNLG